MKWLYIFEDGLIKIGFEPPTKTDLECVDNGILDVLMVDGNVKTHDGLELPKAEIVMLGGQEWHE